MAATKAVFIDIDGTLINHAQVAPPSAVQACAEAVKAGHHLILSSGRSMPEIYPRLFDLGFTGVVAAGGAYARLGEDVLVDARINREQVIALDAFFHTVGGIWIWQGQEEMHPSEGFMKDFLSKVEVGTTAWQEYADAVRPALRTGLPESTSKVTAYLFTERSSVEHVRSHLPQDLRLVPGSVPAEGTFVVEVMPSGVSKGAAMEVVAAHLGLAMSDTIALGDSHNDIEALQAAGVGVAMGIAPPEVREAADLVTGTVDEDGLAQAFRTLGLI